MVVSFEFISAKQLVNEYESYSDTTLVGELQDCTYSLAFGNPGHQHPRIRTVQKVFKDTRYFFMDDESIQKLTYVSIINVELGLGGVAMFSARAVELLASAVLVCRAHGAVEGTGVVVACDLSSTEIQKCFSRFWLELRLVETRALLLAVQLLVAILATTYSTFDPSNPGFVAMIVLAELSLIVLVSFPKNAHPAAISLVSADILSKEGEGSRDVESAGVSSNMVFRVAETQLSTAPPGGVVSSFHAEK
ncbi:hypothetical protein DL96DRAFT_1685506 [Flagelloscypha sp. PMI_526]|nr:hypothetical protein DL96DRAFT_1685506 [Flagelloscypha sp. PMI_526]